jgi:hypothetical protein
LSQDIHPDEIMVDETTQKPLLNKIDEYNDHFYKFNHTRYRRALILRELRQASTNETPPTIIFENPSQHDPVESLDIQNGAFRSTHKLL